MSKLTVKLPEGWDNKLIMDSKDFATLCDIFERSVKFTEEYSSVTREHHNVAKSLYLTAISESPKIITREEFDALNTKPEEVEV